MKNQILKLLKEKADYVSGQDICDQLGVSRTAIWKNIKTLKNQGYQIDSVNNRGYKLLAEPDSLNVSAIEEYLKTKWLAKNIIFEKTMDSTNARAKLLGENGGDNGTVLLTDCQTAGRGRRGRTWISPVGVNIYFSILLRPDLLAERASMITLVAAMALARAVEAETKLKVNIKWPNDVIINGKKICGILTESSTDMEYVNYVVVGIGVNCNQQEFSDEIKETATSISIVWEKEINRNRLLASFMNQFEHYYSVLLETEDLSCLQEEYNAMLINCGREVKLIEKDCERIMTAVGIDATGALIVQNDKGEQEAILSGEVSVRGIYGYV